MSDDTTFEKKKKAEGEGRQHHPARQC